MLEKPRIDITSKLAQVKSYVENGELVTAYELWKETGLLLQKEIENEAMPKPGQLKLPIGMQYVDLIERTARRDSYDDAATIESLLEKKAEIEDRLDLTRSWKARLRALVDEKIEDVQHGRRPR